MWTVGPSRSIANEPAAPAATFCATLSQLRSFAERTDTVPVPLVSVLEVTLIRNRSPSSAVAPQFAVSAASKVYEPPPLLMELNSCGPTSPRNEPL